MTLGEQQLGAQIRAAREEAGLSQAELSQIVDLAHPQSISNYERGVEEPSIRRLRQIALATGKPISFFTDSGETSELQNLRGRVEELERDLADLRQAQAAARASRAHGPSASDARPHRRSPGSTDPDPPTR